MILPDEAWILRRLLSGAPVNGELAALSGPFRSLGERLGDLPLDDRQAAFDAFLEARDDAESLIHALARVDPNAPARAPDAPRIDGAEEWEPLRYGELPTVEPFPLEVLPEPAARLVSEGAESIGCDPDFFGVAVLVMAGGTIGRSVSLRLKHDYFASATLYSAMVGPPSDGKSPALKAAARGVRRIAEFLAEEHAQAMERWREESEELPPNGGRKSKTPPIPRPRRIDVDDITMEAVPSILHDNPRGLVMIRDELSALLLGMNQYKAGGKGSDRAVILKIWNGDAITKDRVAHEANMPIRCPFPCMSIVGGLTPDMLGALTDAKGTRDGFVDRFLFTYPDPKPVRDWTDLGIADETLDGWCELVSRLWLRPMNVKDGKAVPHVASFSPEGKTAWQNCHNAHAAEMRHASFNPSLRGPWGKFREYAGRLALILACLEQAKDPTADPYAVPDVGAQIVRNAWRLVSYFKSHARRVYAAIGHASEVGGGETARAVVQWLRDGGRSTFSEREVKQARRWIAPADLAEALNYLIGRNAIRSVDSRIERPKPGRPASGRYDVNPALLDSRNPRNAQNPPDGPPGESDNEDFEYSEK